MKKLSVGSSNSRQVTQYKLSQVITLDKVLRQGINALPFFLLNVFVKNCNRCDGSNNSILLSDYFFYIQPFRQLSYTSEIPPAL